VAASTKTSAPKFTATQSQALFTKAHEAGMAALESASVSPMVVGSPSTPLGSDIDPSKPVYFVPEGPCGFAWVVVRPGNSSFARWLTQTGKGSRHYGGGVSVWVRQGGQSVQRKEAYAQAFAGVLTEAGVTASAESRLD
jgi:hypothetical protein